jgi:hypothetical protein
VLATGDSQGYVTGIGVDDVVKIVDEMQKSLFG